MVGDPALAVVVRADLLRALAGADLRAAVGRQLGLLLGQGPLVQACAQDAHRLLAVLQLGLLILHRDLHTGGLVRDAHRGVRGVHRLAAGPAGAVHVDLQVVLVDVDVDVLGLGQHGDGRRRRVDPPLRLGRGHALHPVGAALELEDRVGPVALDRERVLALADVHRLGAEAPALRVLREHAVQVARPQAGLLPAGAALDLDDDVLVVVRVALDHREADLLLEPLDVLARACEHLADLGIVALLQQLPRSRLVVGRAAPFRRELGGDLELRVVAAGLRVALAVADHLRIGDLP